ncbi:Hypothetical protein NTJ_00063 [Nesidiocoris tenuis]|uniref:Gustatory receptor n=1 Tax=Nesidiocoris tenuis TaxID=355587 RepID=A0ABN7A5W0_9HEMI|nr:Hypothetical protein NTJ_00063 [Nesidiocoris tenuis]
MAPLESAKGYSNCNLQTYLRDNLIISKILCVCPYKIHDGFNFNWIELVKTLIISQCVAVTSYTAGVTDLIQHKKFPDPQVALISAVEAFITALLITVSSLELIRKRNHLNSIYLHLRSLDEFFTKLRVQCLKPVSKMEIYASIAYLWPMFLIMIIECVGWASYEQSFDYLRCISTVATALCNLQMFGIALKYTAFMNALGRGLEMLNRAMTYKYGPISTPNLMYHINEAVDSTFSAFHSINEAFASTLLLLVVNCFAKCTDNFYKLLAHETENLSKYLYVAWMSNMCMQLIVLTKAVNYSVAQVNIMLVFLDYS